VHALFLSKHDLPDAMRRSRDLLAYVPMIAVTAGWRGLSLLTRDAVEQVPGLPRQEVDPTGAGDVFATAFLIAYNRDGNPWDAAAVAACCAAASVEGEGVAAIPDRATLEARLAAYRRRQVG
ncbi:MAG TPA: PfkB family carbohydrate kinase, partial [Methylomirabilota bacterium]|nr:PfkB family carbohydrate kinase [Methylomirabilota bacterium]